MAFNALMHPRNLYKDNPPNFKELAAKYPEFKKFCSVDLAGKVSIDFKNPESVRALTRALLMNDFDLHVELPSDSLVPRIPLRLNYILWLEDMVEQISNKQEIKYEIWGIDIGTGASCIYPLLGAKSAGWHFMATERDAVSVEVAKQNVERNGLSDLIEVIKVDERTALCGVVDKISSERTFDFCMCNPPFYEVGGEMAYNASAGRPGRPEPHSATVAKVNEVCAEGGEIGFVSKIIDDSVKLGTKIRIYTSMIGKKASLGQLKGKLREANVKDMCVTTFCQGKTQRWALAWTFTDLKLKLNNQAAAKQKRAPLLYEIPADAIKPYTFDKALERVLHVMDDLEITYSEIESNQRSALSRFVRFSAEAKRNTWSHNRRKRRAMERMDRERGEKTSKIEGKDASASCHGKTGASNQDKKQSNVDQTKDKNLAAENGNNGADKKSSSQEKRNETNERCVLKFDLTVKLWDIKIVVEMQFLEGDQADALHQILQFLKNRCS